MVSEEIVLLNTDPVVVINAEDADQPVDGLACDCTFEKVERDRRIVREEQLLAAAEELGAVGLRSTDSAWHRQLAFFEQRKVLPRNIQEDILGPEDWCIALEQALLVRMPQARVVVHVRRLVDGSM